LIADIEKFLPGAIFKMAAAIPKSSNVQFVRYCGSHFENGDR
jgi:hypothetical protein